MFIHSQIQAALLFLQEKIMHSSRMSTAHFSDDLGGGGLSAQRGCLFSGCLHRHPTTQRQTPLGPTGSGIPRIPQRNAKLNWREGSVPDAGTLNAHPLFCDELTI